MIQARMGVWKINPLIELDQERLIIFIKQTGGMKTMVNSWDSWRYKREISGRRMLQGTYLWLYLVRRLICTPKFTSVHAFIVTHWRSKKYAPQLAPGTESQMDQSIDLAPLKSIDFDLEVSIFTIRFGPNNRSHPLKSIIKANNLLPGSL